MFSTKNVYSVQNEQSIENSTKSKIQGRLRAKPIRQAIERTKISLPIFIVVPATKEPTITSRETITTAITEIGENEAITPRRKPRVMISLKRLGDRTLAPN